MRLVVTLLVVVFLSTVMVVTNPTTNDLATWVNATVAEQNPGFLGWVGGKVASWAASAVVTRHDYVLFSIYELPTGGQPYVVIGVFKRFFALPNQQVEQLQTSLPAYDSEKE